MRSEQDRADLEKQVPLAPSGSGGQDATAGSSAVAEKAESKSQPAEATPHEAALDLRDPSRLAEAFQIFISIASRATITLDVKPEDTIKAIKAMIQDKEGLAQHTLYVRFAGKALNDDDTAANCRIRHQCTVEVSPLGFRGGGNNFSLLTQPLDEAGAMLTEAGAMLTRATGLDRGRATEAAGPRAAGGARQGERGPAAAVTEQTLAAPHEDAARSHRMSAQQRDEDEIARLQRELAVSQALAAEKDAEIQRMAAEKDAEIQRMAAEMRKVQHENALLKTKLGTLADVSEESSQDTSAAAPAVHDARPPPESSVPGWFAFPALRCPRRTSSLEHDLSSVLEDVISRAFSFRWGRDISVTVVPVTKTETRETEKPHEHEHAKADQAQP